MPDLEALRRAAREIFDDALSEVDAGRAVREAVKFQNGRLRVGGDKFDFQKPPIYSVALGKAAVPMASALNDALGGRLTAGILSAPQTDARLGKRWRVFAGGHPLPNRSSLDAARAAFELLREADRDSALVIFLVSGGGSALLEWPRDAGVTLSDLREANRVLVSCGASIAEVNAVRRALSAVKGGGLAALAPRAAQLTLIVSDTNTGRERDVASGPTFLPGPAAAGAHDDIPAILSRYGLAARLPASVTRALSEPRAGDAAAARDDDEAAKAARAVAWRRHYVLLDNARAVEAAAEAARARGFAVETAGEVVEQPVAEGAAALVSKLFELYGREGRGGRAVCIVSGGEFACPLRGAGVGGRNSETALRCAFEIESRAARVTHERPPRHVAALCAGTDGVDGNSPAAGALSDSTTLTRARTLGLAAEQFLDESNAYSLFDALGDAVVTGATGTNVRDLRILLAG